MILPVFPSLSPMAFSSAFFSTQVFFFFVFCICPGLSHPRFNVLSSQCQSSRLPTPAFPLLFFQSNVHRLFPPPRSRVFVWVGCETFDPYHGIPVEGRVAPCPSLSSSLPSIDFPPLHFSSLALCFFAVLGSPPPPTVPNVLACVVLLKFFLAPGLFFIFSKLLVVSTSSRLFL